MTTREWGTIAGWATAISLVLGLLFGSAFFLFVSAMACAAWAGLGVRASVEEYKSPAQRDLQARLDADTTAAAAQIMRERD